MPYCVSGVNPQIIPIVHSALKTKTVRKLLWPLHVVNLRIPGLIWRGTVYFVQNNTTIIIPGDTRRNTSELPCRTPATNFWRQNRSLETQNGLYFSLFQTGMVFEIVNLFSCIFNAISSGKSCLIDLLTWLQDSRVFPACWILIGQFKFPAHEPYARNPFLILTLDLSTTLRQRFRPKYYTKAMFRLKAVPVMVKQWPVTCVLDLKEKSSFPRKLWEKKRKNKRGSVTVRCRCRELLEARASELISQRPRDKRLAASPLARHTHSHARTLTCFPFFPADFRGKERLLTV